MEQKVDNVNHPNHYKSKSGLEVIEVIRAFTEDLEGLEGYYTGNVLKYMCRWKKKNGLEDLKKARVYLDWLIEKEEDKAGNKSAEVPTMLSGSQERQGHDLNTKTYVVPDCYQSAYPVSMSCNDSDPIWKESKEHVTNEPRPNSNDVVQLVCNEFVKAYYKALNDIDKVNKEKENK